MRIVSESPEQTQKIAAEMAAKIRQKILAGDHAAVIAMEGELGAGKTTFIQGFANALGIKEKVKSPTFLLMKEFLFDEGRLYHLDCYRINGPKELEILGFGKILSDPSNIVINEWAERIAQLLPKEHIIVHIDHIDELRRQITITP
ncbi:MAG: tRNA (adenosine(37)-N6)-threonylcarbamoyltransferase complex ATPase subunit type 1 TsaE [Candidatus Yanofskybacteria bacterium]|nr:tRNA (adenosine(37)-N6)-threonylcarbamoyltransferase complex ATPase subunit type 1 TsaE [Candidatus Yanofskybacteria bacterium]